MRMIALTISQTSSLFSFQVQIPGMWILCEGDGLWYAITTIWWTCSREKLWRTIFICFM